MATRARRAPSRGGYPLDSQVAQQRQGLLYPEPDGPPLKACLCLRYEEGKESLEEGDNILFYTDGLVEAHDARRRMFGLPRLRRLIAAHGMGEGEALVNALLAELERFTGGDREQADDITLVTLRRT